MRKKELEILLSAEQKKTKILAETLSELLRRIDKWKKRGVSLVPGGGSFFSCWNWADLKNKKSTKLFLKS